MAEIQFRHHTGSMAGVIYNVPVFPGEEFPIGFPEAIGDTERAVWYGSLKPAWEKTDAGVYICRGSWEEELAYTMWVRPGDDHVDAEIEVENRSDRVWEQSLAFNCVKAGDAPSLKDHDCARHWVREISPEGGRSFKRLTEVPRVFGPRPALQLYNVENAPRGEDIPFVSNFDSTPDVTLEPWMAIESRDGERLIAVVSRPALFLFQNMEYSCIHSAASFGRMEPGTKSRALTRIYFVRATIQEWHARLQKDLAQWPETGSAG